MGTFWQNYFNSFLPALPHESHGVWSDRLSTPTTPAGSSLPPDLISIGPEPCLLSEIVTGSSRQDWRRRETASATAACCWRWVRRWILEETHTIGTAVSAQTRPGWHRKARRHAFHAVGRGLLCPVRAGDATVRTARPVACRCYPRAARTNGSFIILTRLKFQLNQTIHFVSFVSHLLLFFFLLILSVLQN